MEIEIRIAMDASNVEELLKQHPMGPLDMPIPVVINGHTFMVMCNSYVASDGTAKLVLHSEP